MRGFGILGLVAVVATTVVFFMSTGCEDDPVNNCCRCTCYVVDGTLEDRIDSVCNTNKGCNEACAAQCVGVRGMQTKLVEEIDCSTCTTP